MNLEPCPPSKWILTGQNVYWLSKRQKQSFQNPSALQWDSILKNIFNEEICRDWTLKTQIQPSGWQQGGRHLRCKVSSFAKGELTDKWQRYSALLGLWKSLLETFLRSKSRDREKWASWSLGEVLGSTHTASPTSPTPPLRDIFSADVVSNGVNDCRMFSPSLRQSHSTSLDVSIRLEAGRWGKPCLPRELFPGHVLAWWKCRPEINRDVLLGEELKAGSLR